MNLHSMLESVTRHITPDGVGHVADISAKAVGVPVTGLMIYGVDVSDYVLVGTAVLVTVSLIKLAHTTTLSTIKTVKRLRQRWLNRKR